MPDLLRERRRRRLGDVRVLGARIEHLVRLVLGVGDLAVDGSEQGVQLFVDRARARRPSLSLDAKSVAIIEEIVALLDGLPLAIELAAARAAALGLTQVRDDLAAAPASLAGRAVDAAPRHRSLEEALNGSWDRLPQEERDALAALSLFAADFELAAATAVLASPTDAARIVESLLDASLIQRREGDDDPPRFLLLRVVRDFAAKRLAESDARGDTERRYVDAVAARRSTDDRDLADLEAVLGRLCEMPDAGRALSVALTIDEILAARGPLSRRSSSLDAAVAAADHAGIRDAQLGRVLLARASALLDVGRREESLADRERAIALSDAIDDRHLKADAVEALARHAWHEGRVEDACTIFDEAVELQKRAGDRRRLGRTLIFFGNALLQRGDHGRARGVYEDALQLLRHANDKRGVLLAVRNLAELDAERGALEMASTRCAEAIDLASAIGDRANEASFLTNLAALCLEQGRVASARAQLERAIELHETVGNRRWRAIATGYLGRALELGGDEPAARARYQAAISAHEELGNALFVGLVSAWLARLLARGGALTDARALLERAETALGKSGSAWRDVVPTVRREVEELAAAAGHRVDAAALDAAAARVRALREADPMTLAAEVRAALVDLRDVRRSAPPPPPPAPLPACVISTSARWFQIAGESAVSLQTRKALRLVLAALARGRMDRPGEAMSWESLLEAGWPGERVHPTAGAARVYTTVALLRRMGLRWVLLRRDDGYLLDPATPLTRAADDHHP